MRIHPQRLVVILAMAATLGACGMKTTELERTNAALQASRDSLGLRLTERDAFIDDVTRSINAIYGNLEIARSRERAITQKTEQGVNPVLRTNADARKHVMDELADINSTLIDDRDRLDKIQMRLNAASKRYAGLQDMVTELKTSLERERQTTAALQAHVRELDEEIARKNTTIDQQAGRISDQQFVIDRQTKRLNTGYYAVGSEDQLEEQGIITHEGGFLWGLLGATTQMAADARPAAFHVVDKTRDIAFDVVGDIDDVLPTRDAKSYRIVRLDKTHSLLRVLDPERFWRDPYLVIVLS